MNNKQKLVNYISKHSAFSEQGKGRNLLLDFAKGVAIVLMVLGHTFQGQIEQFDDLYGFRFIYSFHMPFFAFLAGASATFWVNNFDTSRSIKELAQSAGCRIRRSAEHLLLPFISWTLIGYWISGNPDPVYDYLLKVFRQPDYSLWFLPCIFWCTTYVALIMFGLSLAKQAIEKTRLKRYSSYMGLIPVQAAMMFLVWALLMPRLPAQGGLVFANRFHGGLFVYFLLGLAFFKPYVDIKSLWVRVVPYVVFFALVPFWHRTMPHHIIQSAPPLLINTLLAKYYAFVVAVAGTLVFVDLSRLLNSWFINPINTIMYYIGMASLGIYAVHFYFVGHNPPVIAAIFISLLIYQSVLFIPIARKIVFGK